MHLEAGYKFRISGKLNKNVTSGYHSSSKELRCHNWDYIMLAVSGKLSFLSLTQSQWGGVMAGQDFATCFANGTTSSVVVSVSPESVILWFKSSHCHEAHQVNHVLSLTYFTKSSEEKNREGKYHVCFFFFGKSLLINSKYLLHLNQIQNFIPNNNSKKFKKSLLCT